MTRPLLFSCRKATRAMSEALDHQLPFGRRLVLNLHLAMCGACRRYRIQIRSFDQALRVRLQQPPIPTMTSAERERILKRLKAG
jgi:predicted anti-sigma-YlaC factor YlaD